MGTVTLERTDTPKSKRHKAEGIEIKVETDLDLGKKPMTSAERLKNVFLNV